MWLFNPHDPLNSPVRAGFNYYDTAGGVAMLPPAWKLLVTGTPQVTLPTEDLTATWGSLRRYWPFTPPTAPPDLNDHQAIVFSGVPTGGTFVVSVTTESGTVESDPLQADVSEANAKAAFELLLDNSGWTGVSVSVERNKSQILITLTGGPPSDGNPYPIFTVDCALTSGGTFWDNASGDFYLRRDLRFLQGRVNWIEEPGLNPAELPALDEWFQSPYLWDLFGISRMTGFFCDQQTDSYWPYYYMLVYDDSHTFPGPILEGHVWKLLMCARYRTGRNQDFVYWTLRGDREPAFRADRPAIFDNKYVYFGDYDIGAPETAGTAEMYAEFPDELILTPFWW